MLTVKICKRIFIQAKFNFSLALDSNMAVTTQDIFFSFLIECHVWIDELMSFSFLPAPFYSSNLMLHFDIQPAVKFVHCHWDFKNIIANVISLIAEFSST